jgi:hypothetical protein
VAILVHFGGAAYDVVQMRDEKSICKRIYRKENAIKYYITRSSKTISLI